MANGLGHCNRDAIEITFELSAREEEENDDVEAIVGNYVDNAHWQMVAKRWFMGARKTNANVDDSPVSLEDSKLGFSVEKTIPPYQ